MREGDGHLVVSTLAQEHALLAARHLLRALSSAGHLEGGEPQKPTTESPMTWRASKALCLLLSANTGRDRLVATKLESALARVAGRTEVVTETGTARRVCEHRDLRYSTHPAMSQLVYLCSCAR